MGNVYITDVIKMENRGQVVINGKYYNKVFPETVEKLGLMVHRTYYIGIYDMELYLIQLCSRRHMLVSPIDEVKDRDILMQAISNPMLLDYFMDTKHIEQYPDIDDELREAYGFIMDKIKYMILNYRPQDVPLIDCAVSIYNGKELAIDIDGKTEECLFIMDDYISYKKLLFDYDDGRLNTRDINLELVENNKIYFSHSDPSYNWSTGTNYIEIPNVLHKFIKTYIDFVFIYKGYYRRDENKLHKVYDDEYGVKYVDKAIEIYKASLWYQDNYRVCIADILPKDFIAILEGIYNGGYFDSPYDSYVENNYPQRVGDNPEFFNAMFKYIAKTKNKRAIEVIRRILYIPFENYHMGYGSACAYQSIFDSKYLYRTKTKTIACMIVNLLSNLYLKGELPKPPAYHYGINWRNCR